MKKIHDLMGMKFGQLTVVGRTAENRWVCECSCGKVLGAVEAIDLLERGKIMCRTCGIQRDSTSPIRIIYRTYERRAGQRGAIFELSLDEFAKLISQPCHWCGKVNSNQYSKNGHAFRYNGVDRKVNEMGYTSYNAVPCCNICNRMKGDMGPLDFLQHAFNILLHSRIIKK